MAKTQLWAEIDVDLSDIDTEKCIIGILNPLKQTKLKAKLPLLLSSDKYGRPTIANFKAPESVWLQEWLVASGIIRAGDEGEDILDKAKDSCIGTIFMIPQGDPESELMKIIMKLFAIGLEVDDVLEGTNILGRNKTASQILPEIARQIIEGEIESVDDLAFGSPTLMTLMTALFYAAHDLRALLPNCEKQIKPYVRSVMDTLRGMCELHLLNEEMKLSEDTFRYLRRYEIGFEPFIELAALVVGVELEEDVRDSLIFRRTLELVGRIGSCVNDLIGIRKDIICHNSSLVLFKATKESRSVADAYEKVAAVVERDLVDLKLTCRQLKLHFERRQNVSEYVTILKQFVDGFLYWCSTNRSRYGKGWVSVTIAE